MVAQITLYTFPFSPYVTRVEIALAEAKADVKRYEINLRDKPEWFEQINPAGRVPALTYGGPDVPADKPSPESVKLGESLAIVEFIAELFPDSGLLPADPVQRAKARFFVHTASNSFIEATLGYLLRGQPGADVLKGATVLDKMLVGKFAIGDQFTVADVALVPLLLSAETALQFKDPDGVLAQLQGLKRLWQYLQDVKTRPSVASAWHSEAIYEFYKKRFSQ